MLLCKTPLPSANSLYLKQTHPTIRAITNPPVCPTCSNMLRVSRVPPGDPTIEQYVGQNRFECLTCPYHFVINKRYYERKYLKKKEVEDILGGKGAWDNVDKTEGAFKLRSDIKLRLDCDGVLESRHVLLQTAL